ncbi:MAG: O-antigen ligase family protein [Deltaproteobacteria bacterium]|nr:O-antigen ligase family protein [Deltaproteobacteria bacterium]
MSISRPIEIFLFLTIIAASVGLLATPYSNYAILPGLAVLIFFILGRFPHIGYYLIVFLIPFHAFRTLSEAYPFLRILRIHWILGFWLLIVMFFQLLVQKKTPARLQSNLWSLLLIFFVINLVSALMSDFYQTSFDNLFLLLIAYLFIVISQFFLSRQDFYRTLPLILVSSISISALLGIIGYQFNLPLFAQRTVQVATYKRGFGAATDPNDLALMIIFTLPVLAHLFFSSRRRLEKNISLISAVISITGVILTFSRGGAIIMSVVLSLLFIKYLRKSTPKHVGFAAPLVGITVLIIALFSPSLYWEHIQSVTDYKRETSIGRRVSYLYVAFEAFKESPILGSGPRTFKDIYARSKYAPEYVRNREREGLTRYAHNAYLEVIVGTGILGLAVFLAIIWRSLKDFISAKKKFQLSGDKDMASIIGAYQLSFISLLMYFLLFSNIYHKYFLLSLALSQIAVRLSKEIPEDIIERGENAGIIK